MPAPLLFLCVVLAVAGEASGEERERATPTEESTGRALPDDTPCDGLGTSLAVDTEEHRLWLCKDGVVEKSFKVSLGTAGVGKHTAGDSRTPLGTYPLGRPNRSTLGNHRYRAAGCGKMSFYQCACVGGDSSSCSATTWVKEHWPCVVHIY
jgi:hypothetical protein